MKQIIGALIAVSLLHLSLAGSNYLNSTTRIQEETQAREAKERQIVADYYKRQEEQRQQKLNELSAQPTIVCPEIDYDNLGSQVNLEANKCQLRAISQRAERSLYR